MRARLTRMKLYSTTVASVASLSCSGEIGQVEPGLLSLQLQPAAAVSLSELEYTVVHEKGFVRSGPVAIGDKQSFSFKVDTLPPAPGYEVTAFARGLLVDSSSPTVCTGHAAFEIKTAQATSVAMTLQCDGVARTGTRTETEQGDSSNNCPGASSIAASPAMAAVGEEMDLSATVPNDDDGPLPIAFRWSADSGVFASPSASKTRYLCDRPGIVDLYFSISDGDQACDGEPTSISVICTGGNCIDATHCPSGRADTGGSSPATGGAGRMAPSAGPGGSGGPTVQRTSSTNAGSGAAAGHPSVIQKSSTISTQQGGSGGHAGNPQVDPTPGTPSNQQSRTQRRDRNTGGDSGSETDGMLPDWSRQPRNSDLPRAGHESTPPSAGAASTPATTETNTNTAGASGASSTTVAGAGSVNSTAGAGGVVAAPQAGMGGVSATESEHPPAAGSGTGGASGAAAAGGAAGSGGSHDAESDEEPEPQHEDEPDAEPGAYRQNVRRR